jgi:uncharacterized membrane protein
MTKIYERPIFEIARTKLFKDQIEDDDIDGTYTLEITNLEKTEEYKIDKYVFTVKGKKTEQILKYYKNEVLKQCWDSEGIVWWEPGI